MTQLTPPSKAQCTGATAGRVAAATLLAVLAATAPAGAHGGQGAAAIQAGRAAVELRDCWMTVAYVPRPPEVLREAFQEPLDLTQTFYGSDPLLGFWAVSCHKARLARTPIGPVILSLVGAPVGLSVFGAAPLANFFSHALLRVDTDSPAIATALRHQRLRARLVRGLRYRHSRRGAVPSGANLTVPGRYGLRVTARQPDPTNPHDHDNWFSYHRAAGPRTMLALSTAGASDRFCFPTSGECTATVSAPFASPFARLLGGASVNARVGFDHARVRRLHLSVHPSKPARH
jgi:hypothetical protein